MSKSKKVNDTQVATAAASKSNANRTAQRGIIADIMLVLIAARKRGTHYSFTQILTAVHSKHNDRAITGLAVTVRAQLSRLPNERNFGIDKVRDGVTVFYAADATAQPNAKKVAAA